MPLINLKCYVSVENPAQELANVVPEPIDEILANSILYENNLEHTSMTAPIWKNFIEGSGKRAIVFRQGSYHTCRETAIQGIYQALVHFASARKFVGGLSGAFARWHILIDGHELRPLSEEEMGKILRLFSPVFSRFSMDFYKTGNGKLAISQRFVSAIPDVTWGRSLLVSSILMYILRNGKFMEILYEKLDVDNQPLGVYSYSTIIRTISELLIERWEMNTDHSNSGFLLSKALTTFSQMLSHPIYNVGSFNGPVNFASAISFKDSNFQILDQIVEILMAKRPDDFRGVDDYAKLRNRIEQDFGTATLPYFNSIFKKGLAKILKERKLRERLAESVQKGES